MDRNQAGRRNCSPEDFKILCGWIYNRRKKNVGGQIPGSRVGQVGPPLLDATADEIAAELDVSPRTVKRNGQRAEVYDAMLEVGDAEAGAMGGASKGQVDTCLPDATAEQVAAELDVSPRTVKRNGQRAEVYDAIPL